MIVSLLPVGVGAFTNGGVALAVLTLEAVALVFARHHIAERRELAYERRAARLELRDIARSRIDDLTIGGK